MGDTLGEIEEALKTADTIFETEAPVLEAAFPGLAAFLPFLGLFKVVIGGVDIVHQATHKALPESIAEVADHNTPGAPNSPSLSESASPPNA